MMATAENVRERAAEWMLRLEAEGCTEQERREFEAWVAADPAHRAAFDAAVATWRDLDAVALEVLARAEAQAPAAPRSWWWRARARRPAARQLSWRAPVRTTTRAPLARRRVGRAGIAAALALAVVGVAFHEPVAIRMQADATTSVGESRTLTLQDGSRVQLNTGSAIAVHFTAGERRIRLLKGEAAFEVFHDASRPFRVQAGGGTTTAVGTVFQVKTLPQGARVTVTEGRVRVQEGGAAAELGAGQQLDYAARDGLQATVAIDTEMASAWRRGRMSFIGQPLGEVVKELDRYHRGRIVLADESLARRPVSGVFETADPLAAVEAIERSLGLRSRRFTDYLVMLSE